MIQPSLLSEDLGKCTEKVLPIQEIQQLYRPLIEEAGIKTIHPIELMSSVIGHGNTSLDITITV